MQTYTHESPFLGNDNVYTLTLEATGRYMPGPQARVKYTLSDKQGIIFDNDDFGASPLHDPEGPESAEALLSFLTLREGDVEDEWFDDYTPRQIQFRDNEAEDLYCWGEELNPEEYR